MKPCESCGQMYQPTPGSRGRFCSLPCYGQSKAEEAKDRAEERFWSKVAIREQDECWPWRGERMDNNYPVFGVGQKSWLAHRFVVTLERGPIPKGMVVDHLCHRPWCVNPAHLEVVTPQENVNRIRKVASRRETNLCSKGHEMVGSDVYVNRAGHRSCKVCRREWDRLRRQRRKAALRAV